MSPQQLLDFWFGQNRKAWFEKNTAFDEEIRARFLALYEQAADHLALAAARAIIERGWDREMTEDERTFAYLPFEHSESLEDQETSLRLFAGNANFEWARRHWEIIRRFGRFPHRNAVLGRESTPEEITFLQTPGSGF